MIRSHIPWTVKRRRTSGNHDVCFYCDSIPNSQTDTSSDQVRANPRFRNYTHSLTHSNWAACLCVRKPRKSMDSDEGKLFLGGIAWDTTEERLSDYFGKYGDVSQTVIMRDKITGRPRGFGFVVFSDPSVLDSVLQDRHTIDGRNVRNLWFFIALHSSIRLEIVSAFRIVICTDF